MRRFFLSSKEVFVDQQRGELLNKLTSGWNLLNRRGKETVLNYIYDSLLTGKVTISRKTREIQFHRMVLQSFLYGQWKPEFETVLDREFISRIKKFKNDLLVQLVEKITKTASDEDFQR